jgi:hypothetical protein
LSPLRDCLYLNKHEPLAKEGAHTGWKAWATGYFLAERDNCSLKINFTRGSNGIGFSGLSVGILKKE